jgi:hypothetical protein
MVVLDPRDLEKEMSSHYGWTQNDLGKRPSLLESV